MASRGLVQDPEIADNGGFEVAEGCGKQQEDNDRAQKEGPDRWMGFALSPARSHDRVSHR